MPVYRSIQHFNIIKKMGKYFEMCINIHIIVATLLDCQRWWITKKSGSFLRTVSSCMLYQTVCFITKLKYQYFGQQNVDILL